METVTMRLFRAPYLWQVTMNCRLAHTTGRLLSSTCRKGMPFYRPLRQLETALRASRRLDTLLCTETLRSLDRGYNAGDSEIPPVRPDPGSTLRHSRTYSRFPIDVCI